MSQRSLLNLMKVCGLSFFFLLQILILENAFCSVKEPNLPPWAQEYLKKFPEKSLTLLLVAQRAMETSTSFKLISSQIPMMEVPLLQSKIPFETHTYLKGSSLWDDREQLSPASPRNQSSQQIALGAARAFESGTSLSGEIKLSKIEWDSSAFMPAVDSVESGFALKLSQNLWKDAFGRTTRLGLAATKLEHSAQKHTLIQNYEDWFMGLAEYFYAAWRFQLQVEVAASNIARRQKLLEITRIKLQRGTAEKQDVLQVESALIAAQTQKLQLENVLKNAWRDLVLKLQLPEAFVTLDPMLVPIKLDSKYDPTENWQQKIKEDCQRTEEQLSKVYSASTKILSLEQQVQAQKLRMQQAKQNFLPQLQLEAGLLTNGLEKKSEWTSAVGEGIGAKNPAWSLGVTLSWPLEHFAEKTQMVQSFAQHLRSSYLLQLEKESYPVEWQNYCQDYFLEKNNLGRWQEILQKQKKRQGLEEQLFQLGRANTMQVIQAGDDIAQAELQLAEIETRLRMSSWKIRRLQGEIKSTMEKTLEEIKKKTGGEMEIEKIL